MFHFQEIEKANQSGLEGYDPRHEMIGKMHWDDVDKNGVRGKYLRIDKHQNDSDILNVKAALSTLSIDFKKKPTTAYDGSEQVIAVFGDEVSDYIQQCENVTPNKAEIISDRGNVSKQAFKSVAPNVAPQKASAPTKQLRNGNQRRKEMGR